MASDSIRFFELGFSQSDYTDDSCPGEVVAYFTAQIESMPAFLKQALAQVRSRFGCSQPDAFYEGYVLAILHAVRAVYEAERNIQTAEGTSTQATEEQLNAMIVTLLAHLSVPLNRVNTARQSRSNRGEGEQK